MQTFIGAHASADVANLALRYKDVDGVPIALLIDQILGRRKAKIKIPEYYHDARIVFPPSLNLEQSSSEATAQWKAKRIPAGALGVDLSGGFGVDARWMSTRFDRYEFVEPDASLLAMVRYNHLALGCGNVSYHALTAEQFLHASTNVFDFIYIDPSRRSGGNNRVVTFEHCVPDVIRLREQLERRAGMLMIKASPLLDIRSGLTSLGGKYRVIVLAVKNECKEVVFMSDSAITGHDATIEAIDIGADTITEFKFSQEEERLAAATTGSLEKFIYVPNAAVLKAGAFKLITSRYPVKKLHPNTHLYTSGRLVEGFPGRSFEVDTELKPGAAAGNFPDGYANIISRNYPLSADELKKKMGLTDGGDYYLIAFTSIDGKHLVRARRTS
ncbi:MAG: class I SAM-dependent methyltransferase [Bacteroidia bacterium]|nr:class I SAM-dependent methyltransferase [Bacteroidia bacterium]